jgi:phosphonate transport system substrate-binding protein
MEHGKPVSATAIGGVPTSRRRALALLLAAGSRMRAAAAVEGIAPVRLAISESVVADVNLNDARAAMLVWLKRMMADLNVTVQVSPKVFDSAEEIKRRARMGEFDSVALNVVEYRQIADFLDPREVLVGAGEAGTEQYVLLVKRSGEFQQLSHLRGRRLCLLNAPKMCVAPAWLSMLLDEARLGANEPFFSSTITDAKASRVILPVFFGQADACVTSQRSFETMCELNPQVGKDLVATASSPRMVVTFYVFHKNYQNASRERFIRILTEVRSSAAGRQMAELFQFDGLALRDSGCLSTALSVLEKAQNARGRAASGSRKGPADRD